MCTICACMRVYTHLDESTHTHTHTQENIHNTITYTLTPPTNTGWSTHSTLNCPSQPPIYHRSTGVYQYGDPNADYVSPADLSFEYFPQFPNPSGTFFPSSFLFFSLLFHDVLSLLISCSPVFSSVSCHEEL